MSLERPHSVTYLYIYELTAERRKELELIGTWSFAFGWSVRFG